MKLIFCPVLLLLLSGIRARNIDNQLGSFEMSTEMSTTIFPESEDNLEMVTIYPTNPSSSSSKDNNDLTGDRVERRLDIANRVLVASSSKNNNYDDDIHNTKVNSIKGQTNEPSQNLTRTTVKPQSLFSKSDNSNSVHSGQEKISVKKDGTSAIDVGVLTAQVYSVVIFVANEDKPDKGAVAAGVLTEKELADDLENWVAPLYIRQMFPYYLAGYDDSGRPLYIAEPGKFDIRSVVEKGEEAQAQLVKYAKQVARTIIKSVEEQNAKNDSAGVTGAVGLLDLEGLEFRQFAIHNIAFLLKNLETFRGLIGTYMSYVCLINVNFLGQQAIQLARPILGATMERVEALGSNPQKYLPYIRRVFGPKILPPFYGGDPNFKPLAVYG